MVFAQPVESLRCKAAEGDREARRKIAREIFGLQREDGSWTVAEDRSVRAGERIREPDGK